MTTNIVYDSPTEAIRIARFVRPDVREALYDHEEIAHTGLYKELYEVAISGLPEGGSLILNLGLIDWFPSVFYRLLLQALHDVRARHGHMLVCCLTENVKEGFDLMGGPRLFEVHTTEARALASQQRT